MTKKQRENMEKNQRTLGKQHMDKIRTAKKKKKEKLKGMKQILQLKIFLKCKIHYRTSTRDRKKKS